MSNVNTLFLGGASNVNTLFLGGVSNVNTLFFGVSNFRKHYAYISD